MGISIILTISNLVSGRYKLTSVLRLPSLSTGCFKKHRAYYRSNFTSVHPENPDGHYLFLNRKAAIFRSGKEIKDCAETYNAYVAQGRPQNDAAGAENAIFRMETNYISPSATFPPLPRQLPWSDYQPEDS